MGAEEGTCGSWWLCWTAGVRRLFHMVVASEAVELGYFCIQARRCIVAFACIVQLRVCITTHRIQRISDLFKQAMQVFDLLSHQPLSFPSYARSMEPDSVGKCSARKSGFKSGGLPKNSAITVFSSRVLPGSSTIWRRRFQPCKSACLPAKHVS